MVGGSLPTRFYLVHFRSAQLAQSPPFRCFWHAFPIGSGFIINQDDQNTFTAHYLLPPSDPGASEAIDPRDIVYKTLGGYAGAHQITIDSFLVHGRWQPSFGITAATSRVADVFSWQATQCTGHHRRADTE
ncbi:hypothetical protein ASPCAL11918 [Aspergillus calidoustus]|uniref:Uncharacterized protein n=1 Tax=Aspergillus calidoustus TaxID=454130 RepID=A0A0U4ZGE8_ASPCI|nr:hypothetical protein ASPCAL11918 [Aspergillus calidoustus]